VRAAEPVEFGGQVLITITITSEKDIPDLDVYLGYESDVVLQESQEWEKEARYVASYDMGTS